MSAGLSEGTYLRTRFNKELRIVKELGSGSQGFVYSILYDGRPMALKWYRPNVFYDRQRFIDNLRNNIMSGRPTDAFLWPLDMTEVIDGSFGYIMELRPPGYLDATELFIRPGLFPSYRRAIDACMGVVSAFNVLHNKGYCYQDVSGGNLFINPQTGKVLICDNDNVAPANTDTGIRGTPRFMAPEIVVENSVPSVQSDRHSLAVLIFMLLCMQHPLEGVRFTQAGSLDPMKQRHLYGIDPVFIMDPDNPTNRPDPAYPNVLKVWPCLPEHMRRIFLRAFSKAALTNPARRPRELDWIRELTRFRSEVVNCPCGNEVFLEGARPRVCDRPECGRTVQVPMRADIMGYSIPFASDTRIYRCQTCVCDAEEALDLLAWVVSSRERPDVLGVMNVSNEPWGYAQGGTVYTVQPGRTVPVVPDMTLVLKDEKILVGRNA